MNRADLTKAVSEVAAEYGWKIRSVSQRKCCAVLENRAGTVVIEPQWGKLSDEQAVRSAVAMFIRIDGASHAEGGKV